MELLQCRQKGSQKLYLRGYQSDHIPRWDAKSKGLYQNFLQSPEGLDSNRAGKKLLNWLERRRKTDGMKAL